MPSQNLLERKLAEEPIALPGSPFWEVFKSFGRDELIALGINTIGTAGFARIIDNPLLLSVTGPIIEKIGFFLAYIKEGLDIYNTTPRGKRESVTTYASLAFKRGLSSLEKDLAVHDPLYMSLMYLGLKTYPQTPIWMLSIMSFMAAVVAVAAGEVTVNELRHQFQIQKYRRNGFGFQSYFESRFYVKDTQAQNILSDLSSVFDLKLHSKADYHDRYFETNLKTYNSRKPIFRLRQRTKETGQMQTAQIVYTRASQIARTKPTQFNFFPTSKDKLWYELKQKMPWEIDDINDEKLKTMCKKILNGGHNDVLFTREVIRNPKTILVSVDHVNPHSPKSFTVVEIKSHPDEKSKTLLLEAMRYIMLKYEVIQTTLSKSTLSTLDRQ